MIFDEHALDAITVLGAPDTSFSGWSLLGSRARRCIVARGRESDLAADRAPVVGQTESRSGPPRDGAGVAVAVARSPEFSRPVATIRRPVRWCSVLSSVHSARVARRCLRASVELRLDLRAYLADHHRERMLAEHLRQVRTHV